MLMKGKKAVRGESGRVLRLGHFLHFRREELQCDDHRPRSSQDGQKRPRRCEARLLSLREDFLLPVRGQLAQPELLQSVLKVIGGRFHGVISS